jgi:hypothetical protein
MSTMKNHCGSFLSRLVFPGLVALLILLSPALVRATVTTFVVSGTAENFSGMTLDSCAAFASCAVSGTFKVDTTTGTVEPSGLDITFPGLPAFDALNGSGSIFEGAEVWRVNAGNSQSDELILDFFTAPTPGSLVGFTGGSIRDGLAASYQLTGGSITPAPEPATLVLFASGMLVLGLALRFGKKVLPST